MSALMNPADIEFGIDSFGDLPTDDEGQVVLYAEAIRATVEEAVWPTRPASTSSHWASTTAASSPSRRPKRCWPV